MIGDVRLKVGPVRLSTDGPRDLAAGTVRVERQDVWVGTATDAVRLGDVQPPGKKPMAATDWARGARLDETARFA